MRQVASVPEFVTWLCDQEVKDTLTKKVDGDRDAEAAFATIVVAVDPIQ